MTMMMDFSHHNIQDSRSTYSEQEHGTFNHEKFVLSNCPFEESNTVRPGDPYQALHTSDDDDDDDDDDDCSDALIGCSYTVQCRGVNGEMIQDNIPSDWINTTNCEISFTC